MYLLFLSDFKESWFLGSFSKNQISYLMKILPVGAELFYANMRTDRHKEAKSRFSKFCKGA
jgi:hypothetical protein